jgi:hypothetical protein
LIVRNRYKLLPCYDAENGDFAYRVFSDSLIAIFGKEQADRLTAHLDNGGGSLTLPMRKDIHAKLSHRETALHAV